jgi:hypothetical protein
MPKGSRTVAAPPASFLSSTAMIPQATVVVVQVAVAVYSKASVL